MVIGHWSGWWCGVWAQPPLGLSVTSWPLPTSLSQHLQWINFPGSKKKIHRILSLTMFSVFCLHSLYCPCKDSVHWQNRLYTVHSNCSCSYLFLLTKGSELRFRPPEAWSLGVPISQRWRWRWHPHQLGCHCRHLCHFYGSRSLMKAIKEP